MTVLSKNELLHMMSYFYKAKHNNWIKSNIFDLYFWSSDRKEFGMFPTFYAKLGDLKRVSEELYGTKGINKGK